MSLHLANNSSASPSRISDMPTPRLSDELAREAFEAWRDNGYSYKDGAAAMGIHFNTFSHRVKVARERGLDRSEGARAAANNAGLYHAEAKGGWIHNYDKEGKKIGATRWSAPDNDITQDILERIAEAFSSVAPVPEIIAPDLVEADLCTVYPAADMHIGLHAWGRETGAQDYDLKAAGVTGAFQIGTFTPATS